MDTYPLLRKCLVVGIILVFVGANVVLVVSASYSSGQLPRVVQQNISAIKKDVIGQTYFDGNVLISSNTGNDYHPRMTTNSYGQPIVVYEQEINTSSKKIPVMYSADHGQTWIRQFLVDSKDIINTTASGILHYPDIVYNAPNDLLYITMIDPYADMYNNEMGFIQGDIANATKALWYAISGASGYNYFYNACECTNNFFLSLVTEEASITQTLGLFWCTYPDFEFPTGMGGFYYDGNSIFQSAPAAELEMNSNSNQVFSVFETILDSGTYISIKTNVKNERLITSGEQKDGMDKYADPEQMPSEYLGLGTDPDVSGWRDKVCVVYVEEGNIICKSSTTSAVYDPGFNWYTSIVDIDASTPGVYMQGNSVYCAYVKAGNLYLKVSEDGGVTWGAAEQKNDVNGTVIAEKGAVAICKNGITFTDKRNGNYDIYYTSYVAKPTSQIVIASISGGFGATAVIKNIGDAPIEYLPWSITLTSTTFPEGRGKKGILTSLKPGESKTIKTGLMVGLGSVTIIVTADTETASKEFKLLLFFFKENKNSNTSKWSDLLIGLIKNRVRVSENCYEFHAILVFDVGFYEGRLVSIYIMKNRDTLVDYTTKIGYVGDHTICGIFTSESEYM